jgi:hypothetical protein
MDACTADGRTSTGLVSYQVDAEDDAVLNRHELPA